MRTPFPLFQSHLDLAHSYWSKIVQIGDVVIDATCGNGHDTFKLSQLALSPNKGIIYAFDIQEQAIESTRHYLASHLNADQMQRIVFLQCCHSSFPQEIFPGSVKLIVYNLGYLPGGNKAKTTQSTTTLQSLRQAQELLQSGGLISITCYPGHKEGEKEQEEILEYAATLSPREWSCCHHRWLNRMNSPTLLLIQKCGMFTG